MSNCPRFSLALSNVLEHFLALFHVSDEQCRVKAHHTQTPRSPNKSDNPHPLSAVKTMRVLLMTSALLSAETTRPMESSISARASPKAPRSVRFRNCRPAQGRKLREKLLTDYILKPERRITESSAWYQDKVEEREVKHLHRVKLPTNCNNGRGEERVASD